MNEIHLVMDSYIFIAIILYALNASLGINGTPGEIYRSNKVWDFCVPPRRAQGYYSGIGL